MHLSSPAPATLAFRGAVALMVIAFVEGIVGLLLPAANLIILLATGAEPNATDDPSPTILAKWRGLQPIVIDWWPYLLIALALGTLLVLTRKRENQYPPKMHGKILLHNTPLFLGFWAAVGALLILGAGLNNSPSGAGLYWIPSAAAAAVVVAAFVLAYIQRNSTAVGAPGEIP